MKRNGRSADHASWYRVGRAENCDVYWHPVQGIAIERDHSYLVAYTGRVQWLVDRSDYYQLCDDATENPGLVLAMPYDLHAAFVAMDDAENTATAQWEELGKELRQVPTEVY